MDGGLWAPSEAGTEDTALGSRYTDDVGSQWTDDGAASLDSMGLPKKRRLSRSGSIKALRSLQRGISRRLERSVSSLASVACMAPPGAAVMGGDDGEEHRAVSHAAPPSVRRSSSTPL